VLEQYRSLLAVTDKKNVLHFVASLAEAFETHQVLIACLFIKIPDLVAVHPACRAANLAAVVGLAVNGAAQLVPPLSRHQIGQSSTPGSIWH